MKKPHTGAGKKREEEGAAERSCYGPTKTHISHPPPPAQEETCRRVRNERLKLSLGKKEGCGESGVLFCLCFSLSKPILLGT